MLSTEILTLPDQSLIANYPRYADADVVVIEVATPEMYRMFSYAEPAKSAKTIKEARSVENLLIYFDNEFGLKRLREM
jgi:hypothetical protein